MNNKYLYNIIMRNVSKEVKWALNEGIQQFDVTEYDEPESVVFQDVRDITKTKNVDKTIFDWFSEAMQFIETSNDYTEEQKFGRDILLSIYNIFNTNSEKILSYDEYTLGELFKAAVKKGLEISEGYLEDIHDDFEDWLENHSDPVDPFPYKDEFLDSPEDYLESDYLNSLNIKEMEKFELENEWRKYIYSWKSKLMDDISDFIDENNISDRISQILMHKTGNLPTFEEWIIMYIDEVVANNFSKEDSDYILAYENK